MEKVRGIRYVIVDKDANKQIDNYRIAYNRAFELVSKHIFTKYSDSKSFNPRFCKDGKGTPDLKSIITKELEPQLRSLGFTSYIRNIVIVVLKNYHGFKRRPRPKKGGGPRITFPGKAIKLKNNKSIRFDDLCVRDRDGYLYIPLLNNETLKAKYYHPGNVKNYKNKAKLAKLLGGTLKRCKNGQWRFIAKALFTVSESYSANDWIGTDFNKTSKDWAILACPDGIITIPKEDHIVDIETEIKETNKMLGDRLQITGGKRRFYNNKRKMLHRIHKRAIVPVVDNILNLVTRYKCGLSIDDVTTGELMGTWGQDKFNFLLKEECENRGIKFYINDCKNTSRKCHVCGYTDKKNRISTDSFECQSCGYKGDAQANAAINCRLAAIASDNVEESTVN